MVQRLLRGPWNSTVVRIFAAQCIVMVLIAAGCLTIDWVASYSSVLGGLVCILPGAYAAIRTLREAPTEIMPIVAGELGKLALSIALFIAVFLSVKPLNVMSFFGTFGGLQLIYVVVPLLESSRVRNRGKRQ